MPKENIYNNLYERAKSGEHFTNLMPLVLRRENILLAYRNIKTNTGSNTAGTDKLTIADIGKLSPEEVTAKVRYIEMFSRKCNSKRKYKVTTQPFALRYRI